MNKSNKIKLYSGIGCGLLAIICIFIKEIPFTFLFLTIGSVLINRMKDEVMVD